MHSARFRNFFLLVIALTFSSTAVALNDIALLSQAAGQYVSAFQYMWHLQNSECGYLVKGTYGLQSGIDAVEKHFNHTERLYIHEYLASNEWQRENQQTYFLVMSSINAPEFKYLTKTQRCNQAYTLAQQLFLQSKQRWEHAVLYFSRQSR